MADGVIQIMENWNRPGESGNNEETTPLLSGGGNSSAKTTKPQEHSMLNQVTINEGNNLTLPETTKQLVQIRSNNKYSGYSQDRLPTAICPDERSEDAGL